MRKLGDVVRDLCGGHQHRREQTVTRDRQLYERKDTTDNYMILHYYSTVHSSRIQSRQNHYIELFMRIILVECT